MKSFFIGVLLLVGLAAAPVQAQDLSFTKFHADIAVHNDASIRVTETITAVFSTDLHGIYRTIPFRYTTLDGGQASIPIEVTGVEQDGQAAKYSTNIDGSDVVIKIGDPNRTISGQHIYTIDYTAQAATNFFADHDELYWNVTGDQWDAPLSDVSATVQFTNLTTDTNSAPPLISQTACYTGAFGSTAQNCTQTQEGPTASFTSQDYLTIVVGWPTGFVVKPANFDDLRSQGTTVPPNPAFQRPGWLAATLNSLAVLAVGVFMLRHWAAHGRDPQARKTVIAQYDPPDKLRPAEVYAVMHEQAPMRTLLPATIVDLAVRGYLQIREVSKEKFLGLGQYKDYELVRTKPADGQLRNFEKSILDVLFDVEFVGSELQPVVALSELKKRKYTSNPFSPVMSEVMGRMVSEKYFTRNPMTTKISVSVLGVLMLGGTIFLLASGVFAWGGILAGLIILGFVPAMPQRSVKGAEAAWVGQGFKLFIDKAEQYRVKWQERENIFEKFLPYAMVFGLADKWSKALADVAKQPDWYTGSSNQTFNTMVFLSAMNNFSSATTNSVVSAAASGSSGFSGGSSGGGGGGGGGGGW